MKGCWRVTPVLVFAITSTAWAQQTAPLPPDKSAQQLASDMQIIQKELNSVGKLTFVVDVSNADEKGTSQISQQASKVVADPATCTIHYHWWESIQGKVANDEDLSISLHDVLGVSMMTSDEYLKKAAEAEGATPDEMKGYYEKFAPPMFMVAMRMAGDDQEGFSFTDEKQAGRVGQAVAQVVLLCGGKNGPF